MNNLFSRNQNGVMVKRCCASCRQRNLTWDGGRLCGITGQVVESSHCCDNWSMHLKLRNAGRSGGRVKNLRYLTYYCEKWTEQRELLMAGQISAKDVKTADDFRREFSGQYGSVYVNI